MPKYLLNYNLNKYEFIASLDVHDSFIYIVLLEIKTGEMVIDYSVSTLKQAVHKIKKYTKKTNVLALYEAGNCGFFPYRLLTKNGFDCKIIAPTSIPLRRKRNKTDRQDSIDNLEYFLAGKLRFVHVPSPEEEDAREAIRFRNDVICDLRKCKQRILSLIKKTGLNFTGTKTNWTIAHKKWLTVVDLMPTTRIIVNSMLSKLNAIEEQLKEIEIRLSEIFDANQRLKLLLDQYQLLPGFGKVTAMIWVLEGGDLNRFNNAPALPNYIGIIPGKSASGGHDPNLPITHAGNRLLRMAAVCSAKVYGDNRNLISAKKLEELNTVLQEFISRMQKRLTFRHRHLKKEENM